MLPVTSKSSVKAPTFARPSVTFESLTFSDGTVINLEPNDIIVFVGPNNAGKSEALRELEQYLSKPRSQPVIRAAELKKIGDEASLHAFLSQNGKLKPGAEPVFEGFGYSIQERFINHHWNKDFSGLLRVFCVRIATETRISDSNPKPSIDVVQQTPTEPIHMLLLDDILEEKMSGYFREAYGKDLILHRGGGSVLSLMVGERPARKLNEDRGSRSYIERLMASSVPLQGQGDGMRSFASLILYTLTPKTPSVIILDEPEAFLHPPQSKLIGEFIATERPANSQLFIATHSVDVLMGLLSVAPQQLRVLRIERDGDVNRIKELDKAQARAISSDPLMKFSSVMSGIFHQRVVICESDADCMFYNAILDIPSIRGSQQPDVKFIHAGGKHRVAMLAKALKALGVKVDVIVDIDVLNESALLKRIVESLDGDWNAIQKDAGPVKKAIEQNIPVLTAPDVKIQISDILKKSPPKGEFPVGMKREIEELFSKTTAWDAVKRGGKDSIPRGTPSQHYQTLNANCEKIGLWIVPVGELEGFCRPEGNKGSKWVQSVLDKYDLENGPELRSAREFIQKLWNSRVTKSPRVANASSSKKR